MYLVGHAQTFLIAMLRAKQKGGKLLLRIEDLDYGRCKSRYLNEMIEDMLWMGISWDSWDCSDTIQPHNQPDYHSNLTGNK